MSDEKFCRTVPRPAADHCKGGHYSQESWAPCATEGRPWQVKNLELRKLSKKSLSRYPVQFKLGQQALFLLEFDDTVLDHPALADDKGEKLRRTVSPLAAEFAHGGEAR